MTLQKPREIAARILLRHAAGTAFLEDILDQALVKSHLPGPDRALVQELCYGCVRWRLTLDWLIDRKVRFRPTEAGRVLLALGLYQLFWLDRIPDHAAVHATVEVTRDLDLQSQSGLINAVLRNYLREVPATRALLEKLRTEDPALGWSHPGWLVSRWKSRLKPDELQAFLAWNNTPAEDYARVNTLKTDAGKLIEAWRKEGVDYDFARFPWVGENLVFRLRRHPPLARLESFARGDFYIQDPGTLLAVELLEPRPGEQFLDLCAAPGGKATYLAQRIDNDGRIVATEPDPRRRQRLQQNCDRLAADVQVVAPEAPEARGPFDAILVDAPCSNTGVLRRRLDARWRLRTTELDRCRKAQQDILGQAAARLRPGGRLVYSTCSVEPEENAEAVAAFLASHPGFVLEFERELHPVRERVDGAYAARLRAAK